MFSNIACIFARQHPDLGCTVAAPFVQDPHPSHHHPAQKPSAIAIHLPALGPFHFLEFVTFGYAVLRT